MASSWFSTLFFCCRADEKPRRDSTRGLTDVSESNIAIMRDQPAPTPRPTAEPLWRDEETYEKLSRRRARERSRKQGSRDTTKKSLFSRPSTPVRRLQISGPMDFRHLHHEAGPFDFLEPPRQRPPSFRPIELSIYKPNNRLSPILPHILGENTTYPQPPPRAYTGDRARREIDEVMISPERSNSAMSFHLPRRHTRQSSAVSDASNPPPIPPKSRARAYTAPSTERIIERIASKLIEKERLQAEIDSIIERQSLYLNSRPSTSYDMTGLEPMPSIPALPAAAPSFAERLSLDERRPRTAPGRAQTVSIPEDTVQLAAARSPPYSPPSHPAEDPYFLDRPLAPPLPLVLRPPLRKKKSFSRISHWLAQHPSTHGIAELEGDSTYAPAAAVTTVPKPLRESDGFYQCLAPPEGLPRTSMETSSSVYTRDDEVLDGESDREEAGTVQTTVGGTTMVGGSSPEQTPRKGWSPASSKQGTPVVGTGEGVVGRVGVAF